MKGKPNYPHGVEHQLEAIRKEVKEAKKEVWWLSTFLVKIPLWIGGWFLCLWLASECSNSSKKHDDYNAPCYT